MSFYLFGKPDERLRLKSYSGASRGGKSIIKIEIEVDDPALFGFALADLANVQAGQRAMSQICKLQSKSMPLVLLASQLVLESREDMA